MRRAKILDLTFKLFLTITLVIETIGISAAQEKTSFRFLEFKHGFHLPGADMADRFGNSNMLGAGLVTASTTNNVFFGVEGSFLFGSQVKEDVLEGLRSFDGTIIGINGFPADITLKERGWYLGLNAGKIFKTGNEAKSLTGIRTQLGLGILQHKIRVQDNQTTVVPLEGQNLHGYDRLTNGPAIHLAAGYQYHSSRTNVHFNILGDLFAASTASRRDFDFAEGRKLDEKRIDILAGLTVSWIVLISRREAQENIYY